MEKLISIIIPVWNVDQFLEKCLDSVLKQSYSNLQIILIDDESPDLSGKICDKYAEKDSRIEVIHQKNGGVCNARNAGMKIAKGDYIGFVDPDDWLCEDMYEYLIDRAEKYDADVTCCRYYRVTNSSEIYSVCDGIEHIYNRQEAIEELINYFVIRNVFWNKLIKRDLFAEIKFPEGRIYEGTDMIYQLILKANKVVVLGEPKYYYVDNPKSYVNQDTLKHYLDYVHAHINRFQILKGDYKSTKKKMMQDLIHGLLKIRYLQNCSKEEIEINKADIQEVQSFIEKYHQYIYKEIGLTKSEKIALDYILKATPIAFEKARIIAGLGKRVTDFYNIWKRGQKQEKMVPVKIEKTLLYKEMTNDILRAVQLCELDILKQIVEICDNNDLKYYLYGGTLLGAVRHKGFIPWDDDIDIVMHREDYERFGEICKRELDNKYFYQTCFTDSQFPMLFTKIRRNNSFFCEEKWEKRKMNHGISVDILPLDGFPDNAILGNLYLHMVSLLHQVCSFTKPQTKKFFMKISFYILKKVPLRNLYRMRDKVLKHSTKIGGRKFVCSYGSHYQPTKQRVLGKDWFIGDELLEFEGTEFRVPNGWEQYLEHLYGTTYMEVPSEEQREIHANLANTVLPEDVMHLENRKCEK